jgi:hypothetical protein
VEKHSNFNGAPDYFVEKPAKRDITERSSVHLERMVPRIQRFKASGLDFHASDPAFIGQQNHYLKERI